MSLGRREKALLRLRYRLHLHQQAGFTSEPHQSQPSPRGEVEADRWKGVGPEDRAPLCSSLHTRVGAPSGGSLAVGARLEDVTVVSEARQHWASLESPGRPSG